LGRPPALTAGVAKAIRAAVLGTIQSMRPRLLDLGTGTGRIGLLLIPLLFAVTAGCSRSPTPATFGGAPTPPGAAKSAAANDMPAPAATTKAVAPQDAPAAALAAPRQDPRWRELAPEELEVSAEPETKQHPELAEFEAEQRRRDAELMAQDAEEAERQRDGGERIARDGYRDARDPRYTGREGRYRDPRDRRYEDDRYAGEGRYADESRYGRDPYDRGGDYGDNGDYEGYPQPPPVDYYDPYEEPRPWDEGEEQEPEPGEYYDPRYDEPYRR